MIIMEEYVLFILNCYKYEGKRQQQLNSWLKNLKIPNFKFYHIIGNENLKTEYEIEDNKIIVKCEDNYESLPQKTFLAIRAIKDIHKNLKFILKTDDDMNVNINYLTTLLKILEPTKCDYYGEFITIPKEHYSIYHFDKVEKETSKRQIKMECITYSPGRFYILSNNFCNKILQESDYFKNSMFEDYAIGYIANKYNVKKYMIKVRRNIEEFTY
jgi:hypothetical protein